MHREHVGYFSGAQNLVGLCVSRDSLGYAVVTDNPHISMA